MAEDKDRPEDVPQWAWEEAEEISRRTANSYIGNSIAVAHAILKAREEAFEEAALIADGCVDPYEDSSLAIELVAWQIREAKKDDI